MTNLVKPFCEAAEPVRKSDESCYDLEAERKSHVAGAVQAPPIELVDEVRKRHDKMMQDALLRGLVSPPPTWLDVGILLARIEADERGISDSSPKWRDADADPPQDEQRVLACWKGSSCIEGMETLIYYADQDGNGDGWQDVHGEDRDPPTHWTLLKGPK